MKQTIRRILMNNTMLSSVVDSSRIMIGRRRVKLALRQSSGGPSRLDRQHLDSLIEKYRDRGIGFDGKPTINRATQKVPFKPVTVNTRGKIAANEICAMTQAHTARDFLEIGCGEGQVVGFLAAEGRSATGIDLNGERFDQQYVEYGANLVVADAGEIPFQDGSFDFVYSYYALEHIADLDGLFAEVYRVLRPGGHLFVQFGPLYSSPWGLHATYAVPVPYCQFLFDRGMMDDYVEESGQYPIRYDELNGWSLNQYRELWNRFGTRFTRVKYREWSTLNSLDLVQQFPECFRGRVDHLDDLFVTSIRALFQRVPIV